MARNGANLPLSNVFRTNITTSTACDTLMAQLHAYERVIDSITDTTILEALRENDLAQVRTSLALVLGQLQAWLALPNI